MWGGLFSSSRERGRRERAPGQEVDLLWGHSPTWTPGLATLCWPQPLSPQLAVPKGRPEERRYQPGQGWGGTPPCAEVIPEASVLTYVESCP